MAIRVRWTFEKNDRYRHLEFRTASSSRSLRLTPREDRDLEAPLFPGLTDARLRMAITRACRATGTPHFSPHGLRRRRGSLDYKRTSSLAEVAEPLGDSKRWLRTTTCTRSPTTAKSTARSRSPESARNRVLRARVSDSPTTSATAPTRSSTRPTAESTRRQRGRAGGRRARDVDSLVVPVEHRVGAGETISPP